MGVYEDATDFDVGFWGGGFGGVEGVCVGGLVGFEMARVKGRGRLTDVVGPLQFNGYVFVSFVVCFDSLNDG